MVILIVYDDSDGLYGHMQPRPGRRSISPVRLAAAVRCG